MLSPLRFLFSGHKCIACVALLFLTTVPAAAENTDSAHDVAAKVFSKSLWRNVAAEVTLRLVNRQGSVRERTLEMRSRENERGELSMLMRFVAPADVRGTALLLIEHFDGEDDRRLYLPALRRVSRISAAKANGPFMSSDFTYYDIGRPKLSDWSYTWAGDAPLNGRHCTIVSAVAASREVIDSTGYSRIDWCVDRSRLQVLGADYYDESGTKFKVYSALAVEEVGGEYFATRIRMEDLTSGHHSEMLFTKLEVNEGMDESLFSERGLRRWR